MRTLSIGGWSAIVFLCAGAWAVDGVAQSYPSKPVRLVVGYVPGGAVDFTARLVGQKLSDIIGQPVVIENRAGAATAIATERVATAPPDGYTLLLIPISTAVQSALRTNLPYDLLRDVAPVSLASVGPFVLAVHPSLPAHNVKELIALARAQPGKLNYGSPGVGSANHLVGELYSMITKVKMEHVPYKGSGEAVVAAASGQAPVTFSSVAGALPLLENNKLRPLAVTSARRVSMLPNVPTLDESGLPGFDYSAWYGVAAPGAVPKDIIARLNAAVGKVVQMRDVKEAFNRQGFEPQASTPEEFGALIRREIEQTTKLIKLTGLKAE
jgi:tripartite-type tricarboxylate transporter receptor subunit TctC